jgi:microcystin-dependent protein
VNFALPDLRGRTPIHVGGSHTLGERGGEQAHTLSISEIPTHTHVLNGSTANADNNDATGRFLGAAAALYHDATALTAIAAATVGNVGGSQAHLNMQPFLTLSFGIALQGIFPSPT